MCGSSTLSLWRGFGDILGVVLLLLRLLVGFFGLILDDGLAWFDGLCCGVFCTLVLAFCLFGVLDFEPLGVVVKLSGLVWVG